MNEQSFQNSLFFGDFRSDTDKGLELKQYIEYEEWNNVSQFKYLTEDFIVENRSKLDPYFISIFQNLSNQFIIDHQDWLNFDNISRFQELSEDVMRKLSDKLNWRRVSYYQNFSLDFLKDNITLLNKMNVLGNKWLDQNSVKEIYLMYGELI